MLSPVFWGVCVSGRCLESSLLTLELAKGSGVSAGVEAASATSAAKASSTASTAESASSTSVTTEATSATSVTAEATSSASSSAVEATSGLGRGVVESERSSEVLVAGQTLKGCLGLVNGAKLDVAETLGLLGLRVGGESDGNNRSVLAKDAKEIVSVSVEGQVADEQSVSGLGELVAVLRRSVSLLLLGGLSNVGRDIESNGSAVNLLVLELLDTLLGVSTRGKVDVSETLGSTSGLLGDDSSGNGASISKLLGEPVVVNVPRQTANEDGLELGLTGSLGLSGRLGLGLGLDLSLLLGLLVVRVRVGVRTRVGVRVRRIGVGVRRVGRILLLGLLDNLLLDLLVLLLLVVGRVRVGVRVRVRVGRRVRVRVGRGRGIAHLLILVVGGVGGLGRGLVLLLLGKLSNGLLDGLGLLGRNLGLLVSLGGLGNALGSRFRTHYRIFLCNGVV